MFDTFSEAIQELSGDSKNKRAGVHLCKMTGEVFEDDNTFVEVIIFGKSVFAKPCMAFGSHNIPDAEWLERYSGEYLAWVVFENGNPAHPVFMGVCPISGKSPKNVPKAKITKTKDFRVTFFEDKYSIEKLDAEGNTVHHLIMDSDKTEFSDGSGNMVVFNYSNSQHIFRNKSGQSVILNQKTILGAGTGTFRAVLGETLIQMIGSLTTLSVTSISTLMNTPMVVNPTTMMATHNPATISMVQSNLTQIMTIQSQLISALSNNVSLD
tara:strand:+ start:39985 stop:40785 length:801 start_codon:yes stop_codon:yes gene_type:complete